MSMFIAHSEALYEVDESICIDQSVRMFRERIVVRCLPLPRILSTFLFEKHIIISRRPALGDPGDQKVR